MELREVLLVIFPEQLRNVGYVNKVQYFFTAKPLYKGHPCMGTNVLTFVKNLVAFRG